jgi:hypothetical protein
MVYKASLTRADGANLLDAFSGFNGAQKLVSGYRPRFGGMAGGSGGRRG